MKGRPLRLIVNGFHDAYHAHVWRTLTERFDVASIESVIGPTPPTIDKAAQTTFHDFHALSARADYGVDFAQLRPLDAELLESLAAVETVVLRMHDRIEFAGPLSYQRRKELYLRHVRYWNHVLQTSRIDAVVFSNVQHETYDYVLAELARRRGVPTLTFHQTQVEDTFITFEDWRDQLPGGSERLREMEREPEPALSGRFLEHLTRQTKAADATPFYMAPPPRTTLAEHARRWRRGLRSPRTWLTRAHAASMRVRLDERTWSLQRKYARLARTPDFDAPFVYVPLHYQPELTTCPLAGVFVDQANVVELLAASVPAGVRLYVKEHPKQTGVSRGDDFYAQLAAIPSVTLVPTSTSTYDLIARSRAVATCTGTAGWESLFRGKPVLLFGSFLYQYARGVHRVRCVDDVAKAFEQIEAGSGAPTIADAARFLRLLAERSHEGYADLAFKAISSVGDERSAANIADALTSWVERRVPGSDG